MNKNINALLKEATRVDYVGHAGGLYKEGVSGRTLSDIMSEIGVFAQKEDGKWRYPPRILEKRVKRSHAYFKYISSRYEFEIVIHFN